MSTRQTYAVELRHDDQVIATDAKYAFNSAIRASEALVREHARAAGEMFEGSRPETTGDRYDRTDYRREWIGCRSGEQLSAHVTRIQHDPR